MMHRREFLKFLGLAPLAGLLGFKPEPEYDAHYVPGPIYVDPKMHELHVDYLTDENQWFLQPKTYSFGFRVSRELLVDQQVDLGTLLDRRFEAVFAEQYKNLPETYAGILSLEV
jgi:hypothetical protein